jgi:aminoglycoside/choline kinase family phosphotransferase
LDIPEAELKQEFEHIAENASNSSFIGFIHRDFQSRNILVSPHGYGIIDFQGGRLGPLQYDLASLLIDPYVELPEDLQENLVSYYMDRLSERMPFDRESFLRVLRYCRITRNLQALGAFGFLSRVKSKKDFEAYIPPAVLTLKKNIKSIDLPSGKLRKIIENL